MATRDQAIDHLSRYAALSRVEAEALVDAVAAAAAAEVYNAIAEPIPTPTALAEVRAARLASICSHLAPARLLRPVEVAVLFRVPVSGARAVINKLRASYPQLVEEWTRELIRSQANVPEDISTDVRQDYWQVSFKDPAVLDYAYELLVREGMTLAVARLRSEQALQFPRRVRDRHDDLREVREVLGI
jgi:hypothetical protein